MLESGGRGGYGWGQSSGGGAVHGVLAAPVTAGGGGGDNACTGGTGGAGGGTLRLVVANTLTVDGLVTAAGAPGTQRGGGGAGGSIWASVGQLAGGGTLTADGGAGGAPSSCSGESTAGGGGGGRIAIDGYSAVTFPLASLLARGGSGTQTGGAGTVLLRGASAQYGQLRLVNTGVQGATTELVDGAYTFATALVAAGTRLELSSGDAVSLTQSLDTVAGTEVTAAGAVTLLGAAVWTHGGDLTMASTATIAGASGATLHTVAGSTFLVNARELTCGTLTLEGALAFAPGTGGVVYLSATTLSLAAGATISANGGGFVAASGPGAGGSGTSCSCSAFVDGRGAGHGGAGGPGWGQGSGGGVAYGSEVLPLSRGSGGGNNACTAGSGGTGGGAVRLHATGTMSINGAVSANGNAGAQRGGGGAGGSVFVTAGTLAGSGSIAANGGAGGAPSSCSGETSAGGGGGGRVALFADSKTYTGGATVTGGAGTTAGGAGKLTNPSGDSLLSLDTPATGVRVERLQPTLAWSGYGPGLQAFEEWRVRVDDDADTAEGSPASYPETMEAMASPDPADVLGDPFGSVTLSAATERYALRTAPYTWHVWVEAFGVVKAGSRPSTFTTAMEQREPGGAAVALGGTLAGDVVEFRGSVVNYTNANSLIAQVEVQPVGTPFTGVPSAESDVPVASGALATVTVSGLAAGGYHWQAQLVDSVGNVLTAWRSFGENPEADADFVR